MIRLNGVEYNYLAGMSLQELVTDYNNEKNGKLAFDGFAVIINNNAIQTLEAPARIISDNDNILIIPLLDGG